MDQPSPKPAAKGSLKAGVIPVTPFQQNCTLLWDEASKAGAVVDPGGDVENILAAVQQVGAKVEKLLLTHGHIDHAGGAAELKERLEKAAGRPVPIEGPHREDKWLLDSLAETGRGYGIAAAREVTPDRWLAEGDTVTVAGHTFEILHCPGHSPGSVVYFNRAQRFALVGDVIFQGGVGRTDFPRGDHEALIASIRSKLFPLGDDVQFICGHGPGSTLGHERRTNPFVRG